MKSLFKKLKNKAGETLIEAMAAILVFTMASIVMFSMVSSAANINMMAKEMDKENQQHMVAVEKGEPDSKNGTAVVSFKIGSTEVASATVDIYGGKDDSLFTYFLQTGTGG